jgi:hypothetical protein
VSEDANSFSIDPHAWYRKAFVVMFADCDERSIERWVKARKFPRPVKVGREPMWSGARLIAWLRDKDRKAND